MGMVMPMRYGWEGTVRTYWETFEVGTNIHILDQDGNTCFVGKIGSPADNLPEEMYVDAARIIGNPYEGGYVELSIDAE